MTVDPILAAFSVGFPVQKGSVSDLARRSILVLASPAEIQDLAVPLRSIVAHGRDLWVYDAADTTSAHDGAVTLVSADGRRYKRVAGLATATAADLVTILGEGGLDVSTIAGASEAGVLGTTAAGAVTWLDPSALANLIDDALGSSDWRSGAAAATSSKVVAHLPANGWTGQIGADGRLVQMGDGSLRVGGGGSRYFNADPTAANIGTLRALGVPRGVTVAPGKIWQGASSGWFVDNLGWPWAWGGNTYGVLGDGTTTSRALPKRIEWFVTNGFKVASIVPHTTGLEQDCLGVFFLEDGGAERTAYLGYNGQGAAGDGTTASGNKTTPVIVGGATPLTGITYLHASAHPITVVARNAARSWWGWGANTGSCLGITGTNFTTPQALTAMAGWTKALCGNTVTIALTAEGGARVAGQNTNGEMGQNNTSALTGWQTPIGLASGVVDIAVGQTSGAQLGAIVEAGGARTLWCWGYNGAGALGLAGTSILAPAAPTGPFQGSVKEVKFAGIYNSGAYEASYVRTADDRLYAAGYNGNLQLTIGIVGSVSTFTEVVGLRGTIVDWAVVGFANAFGLLVLTDEGCFSSGYHTTGAAGTGPTLTNEAVLQHLWIP